MKDESKFSKVLSILLSVGDFFILLIVSSDSFECIAI